ncbi:Fc.00g102850.m01.CDS01 [Cosmosporella sp. VM-42]
MLSRFNVFRSFIQVAFCYHAVDFFALMATMTLLLAHLDSYRASATDNLLAHQALSDRAMIKQAADLLRRLLAIEAEAAVGHDRSVESVSIQAPETETKAQPAEEKNGAVRVHIPYFGIIKIAREGVVSKEKSRPESLHASNGQTHLNQPLEDRKSVTARSHTTHTDAVVCDSGVSDFGRASNAGILAPGEMDDAQLRELPGLSTGDDSITPRLTQKASSAVSDPFMHQCQSP